MKKKWLVTALLALACACTGAVALAGCAKDEHVHDYSTEWTASSDGKMHYHKCLDGSCNSFTGAEEHTYGAGVENTASTCYSAGSETYTCTKCGHSKTEDLPLLEHTWGAWAVNAGDEPTETAKGKATRSCTITGCNGKDEMQIPNLTEGEFNTTVTTPVSCTVDGVTKYTYTSGNNSVSFNVIVPKAHKYVAAVTWNGANPESAVITCENCSDVEVHVTKAAEEIKDELVQKSATCQEEGYSKIVATIIYGGQTMTDEHISSTTPKRDHNFAKWASDETNHWKVCYYDCGTRDESFTEAQHDFDNPKSNTITTHPTADTKGVRTITCTCGKTKTVEFDGIESSCEVALKVGKDGAITGDSLVYVKGTYYHMEGESTPLVTYTTYLTFSDITPTASSINSLTVTYSLDGETYLPVGSSAPVTYYKNSDGTGLLRFNKVNNAYPEVTVKLQIYVTEESIAVEKVLKFAPVPTLEKPQIYVYSESELAYGWVDFKNTTLYLGQEYKIKALGYSVTVAGQTVTLNAEGEGTYTAETAGEYTVTATSVYKSSQSYTATLTVNGVPDVTAMLDGTYAGGDYTVTFGDSNTITVSKDGADDITLNYNTDDGFATTGNDNVSIVLTPTYKLVLVNGEVNTVLTKQNADLDAEIRALLSGTTWTKKTYSDENMTFTISVSFNSNGSGSITKNQTVSDSPSISTFNFTYSAEKVDGTYKLTFTFVSYNEDNVVSIWEIGNKVGSTKPKFSNDFSIINKNSTVTVNDGTVSLSLWLLTGGTGTSSSTEQSVAFTKVVATD